MKKYRVEVNSVYGNVNWYKFGTNILHREEGPAIECPNGYKEWWTNGLRHREDGPAIEHAGGAKGYWIHGKSLTEAEFFARKQNSTSPCDGKIVEIDGKKYTLTEVK